MHYNYSNFLVYSWRKEIACICGKENKNIQTQQVANEKEKKVAEEFSQVSEGEIISTMHKMVHQKVKSSEKWGFVEMTNKEISNVKRDIENSTGFQYKMKLFSIINRWERGDFSQTVEEHNFYGAFKVEILARQQNVYHQKRKSSI